MEDRGTKGQVKQRVARRPVSQPPNPGESSAAGGSPEGKSQK